MVGTGLITLLLLGLGNPKQIKYSIEPVIICFLEVEPSQCYAFDNT